MARLIDPTTRSLPFAEWPTADRHAWNNAVAEGDIFDGTGPAAHWAPRTRKTNIQHYGRWLGFPALNTMLSDPEGPAERATAERVRLYADHLGNRVAPRTQLSMLVGLKVTLQAMAPERDWRWLQKVCNSIQRSARPMRNKRERILPSGRIYAAACREMDTCASLPVSTKAAIRYRDAFMLALFTARPVRVKNAVAIELRKHLVPLEGNWLLRFTADEVKNREPLSFLIPEDLVSRLDAYLKVYRPCFPDAGTSLRLWLSKDGADLGPGFIYQRIAKITNRLLGHVINPHLLRDCAASSLANDAPDALQSARSLLGHRHASTTERYYIHADQRAASRRINNLIDGLKAECRTGGWRGD